jgi:hypothetical protein
LTLELSTEEAEAVAIVLNRVGGDPVLSKRRLIDGVLSAMREAGVFYRRDGFNDGTFAAATNSVYFKSEKPQ